ncbi:hypothetical protein K2173_022199 [Erythroxylum novogranatense]|uniref:Protein TIFY n=1 Tax=Erythroxylum novogranatense TaxID=1862640 RepID=A0AAV8SUI1_9ROSI|nr:hypothetical protein K2173_022199 [Erythroxylum novogranatense]
MDLEAEYWKDRKQIRENLDMSQTTLCMFRKYLFPKSRINSSSCKTKSVLPSFGAGAGYIHRPPTLLERSILPAIRSSDSPDSIESSSSPSQAQLTIFYAGVINVYDNVPVDKAQAIMLLAGESSLSKPTHLPNSSETTKSVVLPRSNSFRSSQSELPIARKTSLQHFLERRRHRITSKSPYSNIDSDEKRKTSKSPYSNKNSDDKERENKHSEGDYILTTFQGIVNIHGLS